MVAAVPIIPRLIKSHLQMSKVFFLPSYREPIGCRDRVLGGRTEPLISRPTATKIRYVGHIAKEHNRKIMTFKRAYSKTFYLFQCFIESSILMVISSMIQLLAMFQKKNPSYTHNKRLIKSVTVMNTDKQVQSISLT